MSYEVDQTYSGIAFKIQASLSN